MVKRMNKKGDQDLCLMLTLFFIFVMFVVITSGVRQINQSGIRSDMIDKYREENYSDQELYEYCKNNSRDISVSYMTNEIFCDKVAKNISRVYTVKN